MNLFFVIFFIIPGIFAGMIVVLTFGITRLTFPGELAAVEQLRKDSTKLSSQSSQDVVGQVTKWNQSIASAQAYRKLWWARWSIAPGWEQVELIPIPK